MTLPPDRIGDKGQRFLIQTQDWPKERGGWQNAAYTNSRSAAESMRDNFLLAPGCHDARIIDRG
mgnify:CR=1 FL=1